MVEDGGKHHHHEPHVIEGWWNLHSTQVNDEMPDTCSFLLTPFVDHVARMGGHLKAHLVDGREFNAEVTSSCLRLLLFSC